MFLAGLSVLSIFFLNSRTSCYLFILFFYYPDCSVFSLLPMFTCLLPSHATLALISHGSEEAVQATARIHLASRYKCSSHDCFTSTAVNGRFPFWKHLKNEGLVEDLVNGNPSSERVPSKSGTLNRGVKSRLELAGNLSSTDFFWH